jgi:hypothetical protein
MDGVLSPELQALREAAADKIAREVVEALRERPHQRGSAWPLELFLPLAKEYLRLRRDHDQTT